MIVDIDVHAAAGTSEIFEADPSVLVCSLHHGSPNFYPQNTGQAWAKKTGPEHMGVGEGNGFNVNVRCEKREYLRDLARQHLLTLRPLSRRSFASGNISDGDFITACEDIILPIGQEFRPDIIIVSAGFGAAEGDCGQCHVSPQGFAHFFHLLMRLTNGRLIVAAEGGYSPPIFAECIGQVLATLLGDYKSKADHSMSTLAR